MYIRMNQTLVILRTYKYKMRVEAVRRTAGVPTGASAPNTAKQCE